MKVLYFHQHFSTPRGATGIRSYEMARALVARGHSVTMVCGSYGGGDTGLEVPFRNGVRRGIVDGIEVVEYSLGYSNKDGFARRAYTFARFALRSIKLAIFEPCDVVFATSTPLTAGIPGIAARWLRRKPFVFEVRDLWPELPREMGVITNPIVLGLMSVLEWASYRSAHRLVGLSPGIVAGITRRGVNAARVIMIPNGCDLALFGGNPQLWRPAGVDATDLMAVFAGTHGQANGLDAALDCAAELLRRGRHDIKIVLIGEGQLKQALLQRAERERMTNVVFCAPVNKAKLAGLMATSDVGLQLLANVPAFYFGTSPNKFFDYLASALPTLINYPGWLAEIVEHHRCGFAVKPDNAAAFADALESAADHRDALRQMGQRARELARTTFDRTVLAQQWVDWLEATYAACANQAYVKSPS